LANNKKRKLYKEHKVQLQPNQLKDKLLKQQLHQQEIKKLKHHQRQQLHQLVSQQLKLKLNP
jgi:hypothetical protein